MIFYLNMNKKLEHVIHIFIIRFMQDNYHSGDVIFSLRYLTLGDKQINKNVYT